MRRDGFTFPSFFFFAQNGCEEEGRQGGYETTTKFRVHEMLSLLADLASSAPAADIGLMFHSAPVEVLDELELKPEGGTLPQWLAGRFLQNSASQYEQGSRDLDHTFDGYGKVLSWRFDAGRCFFRARFLQSNYRVKSLKEGDVCPSRLFGNTTPAQGARQSQALYDGCSDNCNVNIFEVAGKPMATTDSEVRLSLADDLSSAPWKWADSWGTAMDKIAAAHPRRAAAAGAGAAAVLSPNASINYVMRINPAAVAGLGNHTAIVYAVDEAGQPAGSRRELARILAHRLSYAHSLLATPRYAVLPMAPLYWRMTKLMAADSILDSMDWVPDEPALIHVVDLRGGQPVRTFETPAWFGFHHINAYETEGGDVVFDTLASNMSTGKPPVAPMTLLNMRDAGRRDALGSAMSVELPRYTLPRAPPAAGAPPRQPTMRVLPVRDAVGGTYTTMELPKVADARNGRRHCFVYAWAPFAAGARAYGDMALVKKDVCDEGAPALAWRQDGHFPGEATFVGAPGASAEDDGVVLSVVLDGARQATYLLVLNASSMAPLARLYSAPAANVTMGFGIHGAFVPAWRDA
jgi:beta-carotene 15,15'-monooxygenase/beta,beta-carotene 9',10'-dioxygenase